MRYDQFSTIIADVKPKVILEIGTWNGNRAMQLVGEALKHVRSVHYIGYDLFEEATSQTDEEEFNVKKHSSVAAVTKVLNNFRRRKLDRFTFELHRGNTRAVLKGHKADLVFIDGGHSLETIRHDYETLKNNPVIVLDDYYFVEENGAMDLDQFGCNHLVDEISAEVDIEILPNRDKFYIEPSVVGGKVIKNRKAGGQVAMVLVRR